MSCADNLFAQSRTFDKSIATQYAFFLIAPCCEQTLHYSQNNLWFYLLWNLYLHFQWTALFWVENNCIYYDQRQTYHLTTRFPHAPETDQRSKYAMQAEKPSGLECALKKNWKKITCNVPCVRFSQRRANCRWEGLQHEKFCPASCMTIAGNQFAFIWSWVDTFFTVWCLQRLPELLPRDENATPPIPENRAHGLVGLYGKRIDRNLSPFRPLGQIYQ